MRLIALASGLARVRGNLRGPVVAGICCSTPLLLVLIASGCLAKRLWMFLLRMRREGESVERLFDRRPGMGAQGALQVEI